MTRLRRSFVQIGATRDGLDPYLDCARHRSMPAILVETPAYLRWRNVVGGRPFDLELAVDRPEDPGQVRAALDEHLPAALVLAGFERYAPSAFALAALLETPPWTAAGPHFGAPTKDGQRRALATRRPAVAQPAFATFRVDDPRLPAMTGIGFPQVVKPADGGGGLGVFRVGDVDARNDAIALLQGMENYGGGRFSMLLVEELVPGVEYSLQAVAFHGRAIILAVCEKLVGLEVVPGHPTLDNFREIGHVARHGQHTPAALLALAQECLDATGYRSGPFHLDAIVRGTTPMFLEMGFRLSGGGVTRLVERVTGVSWAEAAFGVHLDDRAPALADPPGPVLGHVSANAAQLDRAERLRAAGAPVEVLRRDLLTSSSRVVLSDTDAARLTPDRLRHATSSGRVVAFGDRPETVRRWLERSLATPVGR